MDAEDKLRPGKFSFARAVSHARQQVDTNYSRMRREQEVTKRRPVQITVSRPLIMKRRQKIGLGQYLKVFLLVGPSSKQFYVQWYWQKSPQGTFFTARTPGVCKNPSAPKIVVFRPGMGTSHSLDHIWKVLPLKSRKLLVCPLTPTRAGGDPVPLKTVRREWVREAVESSLPFPLRCLSMLLTVLVATSDHAPF